MLHNPYAAPSSPLSPLPVVHDPERLVTPEIMEAMTQTRPWVRFLGVLGIVGCGLMVMGALWSVVAFGGFDGFQFLSGILYLAFAALYLFPSIALLRYGGAIKSLQLGNGVEALTVALREQKSFWRYTGVLMIVVLAVYALAFVGMLVFVGTRF